MKVFVDPKDYYFDLPLQCQQLEVVDVDPTSSNQSLKAALDLFTGPLEFLNEIEESQRDIA